MNKLASLSLAASAAFMTTACGDNAAQMAAPVAANQTEDYDYGYTTIREYREDGKAQSTVVAQFKSETGTVFAMAGIDNRSAQPGLPELHQDKNGKMIFTPAADSATTCEVSKNSMKCSK